MAEFVMPKLGADMTAGTLLAWLKQPGDAVKRGDLLAEVDTDKGVIEVEVFADGVVERFLINPGDEVPVGTPLAIIREEGAGAEAEAPPVVTPPVTEPSLPTPPQAEMHPPPEVTPPGAAAPAHLARREEAGRRVGTRPGEVRRDGAGRARPARGCRARRRRASDADGRARLR